MTIEIHEPELEALIQQRMASGAFRSVEDVLKAALQPAAEDQPPRDQPKESLDQMFARVRGLFTDEEIDTMFRRDPSPGRSIDLS
jgi:Arc/MetJ-type ribon-helix-helix transcriptional regulator